MIFQLVIVVVIFCLCIIQSIQLNIPFRPLIQTPSSPSSYNQQISQSSSSSSSLSQQTVVEQIIPDVDQKEAIITTNRATLVIAGPGSGKTRVLSARLAYLLQSAAVTADKILLISYTPRAADNLKSKADELLHGTVATTNDITCASFHSFCRSVVFKHSELICPMQNKEITIADENDKLRLMLKVLESKGMSLSQSATKNILRQIEEWKELGLGYQGIRPKIHVVTPTQIKAYELYPSYQSKLKSESAIDLGDVLLLTISLFRQFPHVLQNYRKKFSHILIDEFQDISPVQYDILRMLVMGGRESESYSRETAERSSQVHEIEIDRAFQRRQVTASEAGKGVQVSNNNMIQSGSPLMNGVKEVGGLNDERNENIVVNVFAAGDDDQSIFDFHGTRSAIMKRFRFDFPDSKLMKFHVSYRLPETLYQAAEVIVSKLPGRITKTLHKKALLDIFETEEYENYDEDSSINDNGANIEIRKMKTDMDEVEWIMSYLEQKLSSKPLMNRPEAIAIIVRKQQDIGLLAQAMNSKKIPFRPVGSGFWTLPKEGSSPLSLLRLIASPDDDIVFQAALDNDLILSNVDQNDIKNIIMPTIRKYAEQKQLSLIKAASGCVLTKQLKGNNYIAIEKFIMKLAAWKSDHDRYFRKGVDAEKITYAILQSAYASRWDPKTAAVVQNLSKKVSSFNTLSEFFTALRLDGDLLIEDTASTGPSATIWLMNMYAAKGLEFDEVLLPFWTDGTVPQRKGDEERKLAFVSLTRARSKVLISNAKFKVVSRQELKPSPFIKELLDLKFSHISFEEVQSSAAKVGSYSRGVDMQPPQYDYSTAGNDLKTKQSSLSKSVALNRPTKNSISTILPPFSSPSPSFSSSSSSLPSSSSSFSSSSSSWSPQSRSFPPQSPLNPYLREGDLRSGLFDKIGNPSISKIIGRHNDLSKTNIVDISTVTPPSSSLSTKTDDEVNKIKATDIDVEIKKTKTKSTSPSSSSSSSFKAQPKTAPTVKSSKSPKTLSVFTDIKNLTSTKVANLLTSKTATQQELKTYFKDALRSRFDVSRGSISISSSTNKAISKCTAQELGQYLQTMIKNEQKINKNKNNNNNDDNE